MTSAMAQASVLLASRGRLAASRGAGGRPRSWRSVCDHERGERRADRPDGDRQVERGDRVGGGLDQALDGPDRRDRQGGAKMIQAARSLNRHDAPGCRPRSEHAARERVDRDQDARGLEHGVDQASHARIGKIETRRARSPQAKGRRAAASQREEYPDAARARRSRLGAQAPGSRSRIRG